MFFRILAFIAHLSIGPEPDVIIGKTHDDIHKAFKFSIRVCTFTILLCTPYFRHIISFHFIKFDFWCNSSDPLFGMIPLFTSCTFWVLLFQYNDLERFWITYGNCYSYVSVMTMWLPVKMCSSDQKLNYLFRVTLRVSSVKFNLRSVLFLMDTFSQEAVIPACSPSSQLAVTLAASPPDDAYNDLTANSILHVIMLSMLWSKYAFEFYLQPFQQHCPFL